MNIRYAGSKFSAWLYAQLNPTDCTQHTPFCHPFKTANFACKNATKTMGMKLTLKNRSLFPDHPAIPLPIQVGFFAKIHDSESIVVIEVASLSQFMECCRCRSRVCCQHYHCVRDHFSRSRIRRRWCDEDSLQRLAFVIHTLNDNHNHNVGVRRPSTLQCP